MKSATPSARPLQHIASGRKDCYCINPELIRAEEGFNERKDYGDLKSLANDIEANGLLNPLRIHKEKNTENIFLIDGHRRHAAITTILIPEGRWPKDPRDPKQHAAVDCISAKPGTDEIDRLFMQLSMNSGKPLTFLEEAGLYKRILESDNTLKPADIARRTSKTKQAISDSLRLVNEGSTEIIKAVEQNLLAATTALLIIKQAGTDHTSQNTLLCEAIDKAKESNSNHITPRHIPADPSKTEKNPPPEPAPTEPTPEQPAGEPEPKPEETTEPTPPPAKPPAFTLYNINDTPLVGDEDGQHYESNRLALQDPPTGIISLHLISAVVSGKYCFGYRINGITQLPKETGELSEQEIEHGYHLALDAAIEASKIHLNETGLDQLNQALYEAICTYYPEQGEAKEPEQLQFVDCNKEAAYDRILNAKSTNRDGSEPGSGGEKFSAPDKQLEKIDALLDDLDKKDTGLEGRITTTEIILDVIRNTRSIKDLRTHLTKE